MEWPSEITAAFDQATDIVPLPGSTKADVIQCLLDETARRAVWRAKANPNNLDAAYRTPYTPLSSVTIGGLAQGILHAKKFTFRRGWMTAMDKLYRFVAEYPAMICDEFRDHQVEYIDLI